MLAVIAPGQGAQTPGFLTPWLDLPDAAARLEWWSAVTGIDLTRLGTSGDADAIRDTAVAQPLLVAAGLLAADAVPGAAGATVFAGHSVGEITAATLAGALSTEAALAFVAARGRAMATAATATRTGMAAVLGGEPAEVEAAIEAAGLTAANRNGAGQVVAAGEIEALDAFAAAPPARARVRRLEVAGAFHTRFMAGAIDTLTALAPAVPVRDPRAPIASNADGALVTDGRDLLDRLVAQVSASVRWDLCMDTLRSLGVTATLELAPGGTLTGLVKRALPGVETVALRTPDDLDAARALVAAHVTPPATDTLLPWRLLVAPQAGTLRTEPVAPGQRLAPGTPVGAIVGRQAAIDISAPQGGVLLEWLAHDGDPVSEGQPVVRLHPVPA